MMKKQKKNCVTANSMYAVYQQRKLKVELFERSIIYWLTKAMNFLFGLFKVILDKEPSKESGWKGGN